VSAVWGRGTVAAVSSALAGAGAALVVAWYQAGGTISVDRQMQWSALGVAGGAIACLAMVFWTMAGRRAVTLRLEGLLPDLERRGAVPSATAPGSDGEQPLVATGTMARYHRPSCPLVAGKAARRASQTAHEAAGRQPCGVCRP